MRAILLDAFGEPEDLRIAQCDGPRLAPDQVLIKTAAAGLNPVDLKTIRGRQAGRFPHHFPFIPGWDVSGTVEEAGPAVKRFKPGDRVVAYARKSCVEHGTFAEYVSVSEEAVAQAPHSVPLVDAAGLPLASLTALQVIESVRTVRDDTVLVHGGSGGVGSYAVQLLKGMGARVLASCGPHGFDHVAGLGGEPIDRFGDIAAQVRSASVEGVDVVLDLAGGQEVIQQSLGLLTEGGRIASILAVPEIPKEYSDRGVWGSYTFVRPYGDQLADLAELVNGGRLLIPISRRFELQDAAAALRYLEAGGVGGKIVLTV